MIAARITAENADSGFTPTSGSVSELNFRSTPSVWGYFSVDSSGRVHEFADSQIGHLFAWGRNREDARRNMVCVCVCVCVCLRAAVCVHSECSDHFVMCVQVLALKELSIRGDIHTITEYLVNLLESEDYKGNEISTAWLDNRIKARVTTRRRCVLVCVCVCVCVCAMAVCTQARPCVGCCDGSCCEGGWRD
ncbi:MAG: hypothetical protein P4L40_26815 [Terracidiphilus sp.]|nr:hypothetical protein [Terracidiphilus sp.]